MLAAIAWLGAVLLARRWGLRVALLSVAVGPPGVERSPYKALSKALVAGGKVEQRVSGPQGERVVLRNERAPLRFAPGMSLIGGREPLLAQRSAELQAFAEQRGFDIAWMPGIDPSRVDRFNEWSQPTLYRAALALLGPDSVRFLRDYRFFVEPASDDRPFFSRFFRWGTLPNYLNAARRGGLAQVEWGYVVLIATLVQALPAALLLAWRR